MFQIVILDYLLNVYLYFIHTNTLKQILHQSDIMMLYYKEKGIIMALINCPECNNQVSSTAAACPKCGAPIAEAQGSKSAGAPLTTTQETSKKLKLQMIFASIIFWVGLIWFFGEMSTANSGEKPSDGAIWTLVIGLVWYLVTRFRIWWHHK